MDFSFSEEQELLGATVGRWAGEVAADVRREVAGGDLTSLGTLAQEAAELGWLGLAVPAEFGGAGGTLIDACLVVEQLARALLPIPVVGAVVAAEALLASTVPARAEHLAALAAGSASFALALTPDFVFPGTGSSGIAWEWSQGAELLRWGPDGIELAGPEYGVTLLAVQDPARPMGRWVGPAAAAGPVSAGTRVTSVGLVATAAALLGVAGGALDAAVRYASERAQFGRPIGTFQAVQHLCADMLVDVEACRSAVYGAAWSVVQLPALEGLRAAAMAKAWCARAARRVCEASLQVHGGIGFTWECDAHLRLRAVHVLTAGFGDARRATAWVADDLFPGAA